MANGKANAVIIKENKLNKDNAKQMFESAKAYCETECPDEVKWAKSITHKTFQTLTAEQFLYQYCWVVYASGFRVSIIEKRFPKIRDAFQNFDLEKLAKMENTDPVLKIFNNKRKANSFLKGSKFIAKEKFSVFKKRLQDENDYCRRIDILGDLPGIGPITKYHLAKNIGLADEAKPDRWLVRAAEYCSSTVQELVDFLSEKYKISRHAVDVILWRYGADKGLGL